MSLESMFSLSGKAALVAGASRGIGLAIAKAVAAAGAQTIMAARSTEALEKEAAALREAGHDARPLHLDVTSTESIRAAAEAGDHIDILINVAGTTKRKRFEKYTEDEYNMIMQTNLHGLVLLTQKVGARMIARQRGGKVVNIGSVTSLFGLPYTSVYTITKSALAGLTRTLAVEWAKFDIQVNCIVPGFILTELNRKMWEPSEMHEWLRLSQGNSRLGTPEDIAGLAVFLCGPSADYVTGQLIASDGGYTSGSNWPLEA